MAYVDLNSVRANMARTPEESDYTSIKERIQPVISLADTIKDQHLNRDFDLPIKLLLPFEDTIKTGPQHSIAYSLSDYLQLVDWTGRTIRENKRGAIDHRLPPILARLNIPPDQWLTNSQYFEKIIHRRFRKTA